MKFYLKRSYKKRGVGAGVELRAIHKAESETTDDNIQRLRESLQNMKLFESKRNSIQSPKTQFINF